MLVSFEPMWKDGIPIKDYQILESIRIRILFNVSKISYCSVDVVVVVVYGVEHNLAAPLVSISLGQPAIFLLGIDDHIIIIINNRLFVFILVKMVLHSHNIIILLACYYTMKWFRLRLAKTSIVITLTVIF